MTAAKFNPISTIIELFVGNETFHPLKIFIQICHQVFELSCWQTKAKIYDIIFGIVVISIVESCDHWHLRNWISWKDFDLQDKMSRLGLEMYRKCKVLCRSWVMNIFIKPQWLMNIRDMLLSVSFSFCRKPLCLCCVCVEKGTATMSDECYSTNRPKTMFSTGLSSARQSSSRVS